MATPPVFTSAVLTSAQMNAIGLWLVKSQTVGSGVSSVTVTDAFTSDYDNYFVTYSGAASGTLNLSMAMFGTATGYYGNLFYSTPSSGAFSGLGVNNAASWTYAGDGTAAGGARLACNIYNPYLAQRTGISLSYIGTGTSSGAFGTFSGNLDNSNQYSAFTIGMNAGNITGGTIRVYGYRG